MTSPGILFVPLAQNPRLDIVRFHQQRQTAPRISKFAPQTARKPQSKDVIDVENRDAAGTQIVEERRRRPTTIARLDDPIERCSGNQRLPDLTPKRFRALRCLKDSERHMIRVQVTGRMGLLYP